MPEPDADLLPDALSEQLTIDLLEQTGIRCRGLATLLQRSNHVYRIVAGDETLFLKTYTKDWYGGDIAGTDRCVEHETAAWRLLAAHGLPVPEVVLADRTCANPLGRPFVMTRQLPGASLTALLAEAQVPPGAKCSSRQQASSCGGCMLLPSRGPAT